MKGSTFLLAIIGSLLLQHARAQDWVVYQGNAGPGLGKQVVFLAGDEEYRSEEALPMLAKILSQRHGFTATVLFSVDPDGTINPNNGASLSHPEALDSADAIVMLLRFRHWPDAAMNHFIAAFRRGVPIIALRTSTHAFQFPAESAYKQFNDFGKDVLGERWVSHWGRHKVEATRGVLEPGAQTHPILRGVRDIFGDTDVYEAYPPADATILVRGQVLQGMKPTDPPARYPKKRALDDQSQDVNAPMMPVAWTRVHRQDAGVQNKIFCTTMGAATDLQSAGLRRLVVNAVFWGLNLEVTADANVDPVGEFNPTMYGFNGHRRGVKPADHALPGSTSKASPGSAGLPLRLRQGDHIAVIGNALADRMQHTGWLESFITAKHPQHDLLFRNLAVSGDEVVTRARSQDFGSPDDWLTRVKASVIFAFFGFNESFNGYNGVEPFKADLDRFLKETQAKNYDGQGAPRIVLFSPIANERHQDPNYPDPAENNTHLQNYTFAMAEVARENGVAFVDLFHPSEDLMTEAARQGRSLTINGVHLGDTGDKALSEIIFGALFAEPLPSDNLDTLRAAIQDKNAQWHGRYRTVDGYNVYGGRSQLSYESGPGGPKISNYEIMQEEMAQRDVMTANRDERVWAVAKGGNLNVEDSNLPPVKPVKTNKLGPLPDGSHSFLGGEEAIGRMKVHPGMTVHLYATEEEYPDLVNPVQMAWDTRGRLWVAAWLNYPERTPLSPKGDSLLVFEDSNGDGKADRCSPFLDDLNAPTGFQFYKDGVLVMQAPDLWFVRDTNGDGRGDWKERVLMGLDSADSHHTANAIAYDPGGAIYLSDGVFHRTQVETAWGPVRNIDAAIYRYEPFSGRFETYVAYGFANPHGKVFDYWGNDLVTDATGNANYFGPAFSGHLDYPEKHRNLKQFWNRPSRPCPGTGMISSRHFPDELQGNFLNCNVIGFQGIFQVKVREEGSGLAGETITDLVSSDDPNFRPSAVNVGPDGALYFLDWHNAIIGHMQHHLRDPNRDHRHGRIYRMTYNDRPLLEPVKIHGQPIPALLDLLKEPENLTRELAKVELHTHDSSKVLEALKQWMTRLNTKDPAYEHHLTEALWVHQWHNTVQLDLLKRMLASPEPRARAAATRVLGYWRERVPDSLALLKTQAEDAHPRVRLEAVRVASFYRTAEAADAALAALKHPTDYYLDYTLGETMRQLETWWKESIQQGRPVAADNPAGVDYLLGSVATSQLQKLPRTPGVLQALLTRPGIADADRAVALADLAQARQSPRVNLLLEMLNGDLGKEEQTARPLARQLPWLPTVELIPARATLASLVQGSHPEAVRHSAWAALAVADGGFDTVWNDASGNPADLTDLLGGVPQLLDPDFRSQAYAKVRPLLTSVPAGWDAPDAQSPSKIRYVRVELPRRGTLTLAEVQVFSHGRNVAPGGKATQSSTSNDGEAGRAIDGRTDGDFGSGTQTHSRENERNPWWELDLSEEVPVDSVVIWNRTEGNLGNRLNDFTLIALDSSRRVVFKKTDLPAPQQSAKIALGQDPIAAMRRAAIQALVSMGTQSEATFGALAGLIVQRQHTVDAARGLRAIPRDHWLPAKASQAAQALVAWAQSVPVSDRTSQDYIETVQVATDLAGLLPANLASAARKTLRDLSVPVFVLRTVREQMRYDIPRIVVEAGKAFEIILVNDDFMPHNLVVSKPGSRERLGAAADQMQPDQLDHQGRPFIPKSDDVLAATALLEPGLQATLKWTAPSQEGDYVYLCTFPGHWMMMYGQLIVTRDVEAYLAAHPLATQPAADAHHSHFQGE